MGLQTGRDHASAEFGRGQAPEWEEGFETTATHPLLTIATDVFKKEVPEGNRCHTFAAGVFHRLAHDPLVFLVAAGIWDLDLPERQPHRLCLLTQEFGTNRVHRDPFKNLVDRREQADDLHFALLAKHMQRPCAVLAAAP